MAQDRAELLPPVGGCTLKNKGGRIKFDAPSFCERQENVVPLQIMGKGRNKHLVRLRDEALCRRYYYWTEVQRLRFDDALKVLSEREFFLSEERIMSIVRRKCREGGKIDLKPVPKVKKPRLRAEQLELFADL